MFLGNEPTDGRADLYALGCVAYMLLTGRAVFEAEHAMGLMAQHLSDRPVPPSRCCPEPVPEELECLVLACLEKDPEARPHSAFDMAIELEQMAQSLPWTQDAALAWWEEHAPEMLWAPPTTRRYSSLERSASEQPPTQPMD